MNQQSQGQQGTAQSGPAQQGAGQPGPGQAPLGAGQSARPEAQTTAPNFMKQEGVRNEAIAGPFTVRDLTVFAATLVLFIASLIPMFAVRYNLWNLGSLFFLGLGVVLPLIVAALFVARRLAPDTKVRIGSLSVDQFGSVVASFAVAFFFLSIAGAYTPSLLVALIGSLVLLAATVLARFIPFFAGDFLGRTEVPAHIMARDSAVPVRKPKAPKEPKPAAATPGTGSTGALPDSAASTGFTAPQGTEPRHPVSHGATAVGQAGREAARTGTFGAGTSGAGTAAAGVTGPAAAAAGSATAGTAGTAATAGTAGTADTAPANGMWPAANAASSAAASPETGPAAVVRSAQTGEAATQEATVASAKADATTTPPVAPEAERTQLDGATAAPAISADTAASPASADTAAAPAAETARTEAPVAEGKSGAAARKAEAEAARAASATPATAVHPRVDVQQQVRSQEPIGATVDPASRPEESEQEQVQEAFWFAVAQHRTAVDERTGAPLFGIEPGGWVLALEDRGDEFLVQHTDGRVGVLRDLSNIERG